MKRILFSFAVLAISMPSFAQWSTSGNNTIHTNSGNVGIGSTNPQTSLEVNGDTFSKSFRVLGIGDNINGAPWYGIGVSNTGLGGGAAANVIQLGGFAGLSFKTAGGQTIMDVNGNFGIGIQLPLSKFHIKLTDEFAIIQRPSNSNYAGHYYVTGADNALSYGFFTGLRENSNNYQIYNAQRNENALTIRQDNSFVGIGTNNPDALLAVKGKIHAQEVLIDVNLVPDYVFEKKYKLRSLKELNNYITKNKHLPEVSPAHLMEKEGVNVSTINMTLLKKVEELTLYLIAKDKQLNKQQKQISDEQRQIRIINAKLGKISAAHK